MAYGTDRSHILRQLKAVNVTQNLKIEGWLSMLCTILISRLSKKVYLAAVEDVDL
jgi:hypothetical protein